MLVMSFYHCMDKWLQILINIFKVLNICDMFRLLYLYFHLKRSFSLVEINYNFWFLSCIYFQVQNSKFSGFRSDSALRELTALPKTPSCDVYFTRKFAPPPL